MGIVEALRDAGSAVLLTTHDDAVVTRAGRTVVLERPAQPALPGTAAPIPRRALWSAVTARGQRPGHPRRCARSALDGQPRGAGHPGRRWPCRAVGAGGGAAPAGTPPRVLVRFLPGVIGAASVAWSTWLFAGPRPGGGGTG